MPSSKFCRRAVCGHCSLSRSYHNSLQKFARCCDVCLRASISQLLSKDAATTVSLVQGEIDHAMHAMEAAESSLGDALESQARLKLVVANLEKQRVKQLAAVTKLSEDKKLELRALVERGEILLAEKSQLLNQTVQLQAKAAADQEALQTRREDLDRANQELRQVKARLEELQEESRSLDIAAETVTRTRSESIGKGKKSLRRELKQLSAQEAEQKKEVEMLRTKAANLQKDVEAREAEISAMSRASQRVTTLERDVRELRQADEQLQAHPHLSPALDLNQ